MPTSAPLLVASAPPAVPTGARQSAEARFSSAAGIGLLLFLTAAVLGISLATIPASMLTRISVRLAERRQDIGVAMAATLAASAAIFIIVVAV